jgi:hypothetical protein
MFGSDAPDYKLGNLQTANRLSNENTLIRAWIAGGDHHASWLRTGQVFEVTPKRELSRPLFSWKDPD